MHTPSPRRLRPPALSLALSSALLATATVTLITGDSGG